MNRRIGLPWVAIVFSVLVASASAAQAEDPCAAFTWDVSREHAVFASTAKTVIAGRSATSGPTLEADTLYTLQLSPQTDVTFEFPPSSRKTPTGPVFAGFASFRTSTPGIYRISVDQPLYFDVIGAGNIIPSKDFQGRAGCSAPHKVVEFDLPADTVLTLQASVGASSMARVAVTRATTAVAAASTGSVNVLYAGSLVKLMERSLGPAFTKATGQEFRGYGGGSNKLANEIKGELRRGDVFISANPKVDEQLEGSANGDWVHWYILFAQSPLVIAYSPSSRFAAEFKRKPWYEVLAEPGIRIGRTDPKLDPKGAFTLELLQRAEEFYKRPGLSQSVLGSPDNPSQVLPEEALVGRFQSGELDVGFFYSTEAANTKMTFVKPVGEIDPLARYTVSVLRGAANGAGAERFVTYLLGPEGREILRQNGLEVTAPTLTGDPLGVPPAIRAVLDARR